MLHRAWSVAWGHPYSFVFLVSWSSKFDGQSFLSHQNQCFMPHWRPLAHFSTSSHLSSVSFSILQWWFLPEPCSGPEEQFHSQDVCIYTRVFSLARTLAQYLVLSSEHSVWGRNIYNNTEKQECLHCVALPWFLSSSHLSAQLTATLGGIPLSVIFKSNKCRLKCKLLLKRCWVK